MSARVVALPQKLLIEQTMPGSRHGNDKALTESKNASVVRRYMGHSHIPRQIAQPINAHHPASLQAHSWIGQNRSIREDQSPLVVEGRHRWATIRS